MPSNTVPSFFALTRQRLFDYFLNLEIFDRIFPHLEQEKDWGYSFHTDQEMNEETEENHAEALLESIELQITRMPKAYGDAFRFVMHRDLSKRLRMYEQAARRRIQP